MRVEFIPAEIDDADELAPRLRPADRDELIAMEGPDVVRSLRGAIRMSAGRLPDMAWSVWLDGYLICLFGYIPRGALSDEAHPWMVASTEIRRIPGVHTREAKRYCSAALAEYPVLFNYVDARNTTSVAWLKRLGFTVGEAEPMGVARLPFHRFEMRGSLVR